MAKKNGVSGKTHSRQALNDFANQHNPNNKAYNADKLNRAQQIRLNQSHPKPVLFDIGFLDGESYGWCDD